MYSELVSVLLNKLVVVIVSYLTHNYEAFPCIIKLPTIHFAFFAFAYGGTLSIKASLC